MTQTDERIATAEARIKELQLLIQHWRKHNEDNSKNN